MQMNVIGKRRRATGGTLGFSNILIVVKGKRKGTGNSEVVV